MGITSISHNPKIKDGNIKLAPNGRNPQQIGSRQNYRNHNRKKLRENMNDCHFSAASVLGTELYFMEQPNSKISLPYDNEFCCDDEKFTFIENDCLVDPLVSIKSRILSD